MREPNETKELFRSFVFSNEGINFWLNEAPLLAIERVAFDAVDAFWFYFDSLALSLPQNILNGRCDFVTERGIFVRKNFFSSVHSPAFR
jgi:hypothetical protein